MFSLNRKVKDLVPYDPIEGTYRIRLDANESYITLPLEIKEEIAQTVKDIHFNRYPDPYASNVCALFAKYYGVPAENVTAGDGSDELISIIMNAFLQKGDTVMTLEKDFSMYSFYTSVVECRHVPYTKNDDYSVDMDDVIATAKKENARIIIFSNPCNPTSRVIGRSDVEKLVSSVDSLVVLTREAVRKIIRGVSALVVLDEAYMDFSNQSLLSEFNRYDNLIILKTCSKAIGMAAVRLGFAVANSVLTKAMKAVKSPYNVNSVTQAIGEVVFSHPEYIDSSVKRLIEARDDLTERLTPICREYPDRFKIIPSETNFIYVETPEAEKIFTYLKEAGIIIRKMSSDRLRITAGRNYENDAVASEINAYLKGEPHVLSETPKRRKYLCF